MIWLIAKKDFLLNLLSVRFVIGFVLCLPVIPFTVIVGVEDYQNRVRVCKIEQEAADKEMKEQRVWSAVRPVVVQKPEPLSIFSTGIAGNVGNMVKIKFGQYPLFPEGHALTLDNPSLNAFFSIDFSRVIAILISLLALVFSYDAITREREDGTMKLTMTGEVSRISFLAGKLTGLLLTLLPILLFCYLLACLIIVVNPSIALSASDWGGLSLLFLTSVIYMMVFLLLGMFISGRVTHSSSSIIICLLCWIWFLFLMPNIATYTAQSIAKTPLYDNVKTAMNSCDEDYDKRREEEEERVMRALGLRQLAFYNHSSDGEHLEMSGGTKDAPLFLLQMQNWATPNMLEGADRKLFESTAYFTAEPLEDFPTQAEVDSGDEAALRKFNRTDDDFAYLDTSGIPQYVPRQATLSATLSVALGHLCALMGLAMALLLGTVVSFMKYDVR